MTDLTSAELQAQGMAMCNYLHRQVIDLTARLADAEGNKAVLEMRLQAALAAQASPKDE